MTDATELWLAVRGFEGAYEVSSLGIVRSLARRGAAGNMIRERVLKPRPHTNGYLRVQLCKPGCKSKDFFVHRLVLEAFRGPAPSSKHQGCHRDGNKKKNVLSNLRWGTPAENGADNVVNDVLRRGAKHWTVKTPARVRRGATHMWAILNETDVERIRDLRISGCTQATVANWIGSVSRECVSRIDRGLSWRQSS